MLIPFFFGHLSVCLCLCLLAQRSAQRSALEHFAVVDCQGAKREIGVVEKLRGMERLKDPVMVLKAGDLN